MGAQGTGQRTGQGAAQAADHGGLTGSSPSELRIVAADRLPVARAGFPAILVAVPKRSPPRDRHMSAFRRLLAAAAVIVVGLQGNTARAQTPEQFYAGTAIDF